MAFYISFYLNFMVKCLTIIRGVKDNKMDLIPADTKNTQHFGKVLLDIIYKHKDVLCAKKKQMQYTNDYGLIVDNGWKKEKQYFITNLVLTNKDIINSVIAMNDKTNWYNGFNYVTNALLVFSYKNNKWEVEACHSALYEEDYYKKREKRGISYFVVERLFDGMRCIGDRIVFQQNAEHRIKNKISEIIDSILVKIDDKSRNVVGKSDQHISPSEYEYEVMKKLKELGFNAHVTKASGDQGADVIADKDGVSFAIQCKQHSKPIGNKAVQEANAGRDFYRKDYGVVVTNAGFTKSARQLANACDVILLSDNKLQYLLNYIQ